jgi:hypothetical protein
MIDYRNGFDWRRERAFLIRPPVHCTQPRVAVTAIPIKCFSCSLIACELPADSNAAAAEKSDKDAAWKKLLRLCGLFMIGRDTFQDVDDV